MGILQEEAAGQHARAHHGAQQACMCSLRRPTSMHVLTTASNKLRIRSASSDHGGGVLDHGWFTVGSRRNVSTARRADVQCPIGIIRAPHINSRRARYDGMSRLDEDVPTSRAVGSPFGRPTPALWYRARFPSRRAVSALVSLPCTCRRIPRTYAGPVARAPGGRGGVGRRESRAERYG